MIKGDILFKRNTENTLFLKQEISLRHELCKKKPFGNDRTISIA